LTAAFEGIAEELRRQYNVGYYPTEEGQTGQRKKIKVRVISSKSGDSRARQLHCRRGYAKTNYE
jgi:hypothetical protein